jgi:hypothetical protein
MHGLAFKTNNCCRAEEQTQQQSPGWAGAGWAGATWYNAATHRRCWRHPCCCRCCIGGRRAPAGGTPSVLLKHSLMLPHKILACSRVRVAAGREVGW